MTKLEKIGLSAFALKLIMLVLMLGDHLVYFLPQYFPFELRYAGRLVAPVFCYLMTVSLHHTRDRLRFFLRMAIAGLIMLVGNWLLAWALGGPPITNNIFFTLALSAGLIIALERIITGEGRPVLNALAAVLLLYAANFVEGGFLLPVMALVFYFLRGQRLAMCIVYIAVGWALLYLTGFRMGLNWASISLFGFNLRHLLHFQYYQVFAVIPILLYNGRKGGSLPAFDKWLFYLFYPLHVWWLYVIRHLILFS